MSRFALPIRAATRQVQLRRLTTALLPVALTLAAGCGDRPGDLRRVEATVGGLADGTLVLQLNGAHDVEISTNGPVELASMPIGSYYDVIVKSAPVTQQCTVEKGEGYVATTDVTEITVTCRSAFVVGGEVAGLLGQGLLLRITTGDDRFEELEVNHAGPFTFPTRLVTDTAFVVTVVRQPSGTVSQTCTVGEAAGKVAGADVSSLRVACSEHAYTVGGTVSGLAAGASVVLQDNGTDDLTVTNGTGADSVVAFTFGQPVANGATYSVSVKTPPSIPVQACTVDPGTGAGTISNGPARSVKVTCTTETYSVRGSITGLTGGGLVLLVNGVELAVSANASDFLFASGLPSTGRYEITVMSHPQGPPRLACIVTNGQGAIINSDVVGVTVSCDLAWLTMSAGQYHSAAIRSDGSLWTWGADNISQMGNGRASSASVLAPALLGTGRNWKSISAGSTQTVATQTDGTLWGWGDGTSSQLGNGLTATIYEPSKIGTDSNWSRVSAGQFHGAAIRTDGSLWTWGLHYKGLLGDGLEGAPADRPIAIGTNSWSFVDAGIAHNLAIDATGALWSWGSNSSGQLGAASSTSPPSVVDVPMAVVVPNVSSPAWKSAAAGDTHSVGIMTKGSLWTWGDNTYGQLGSGSTATMSRTPIKIDDGPWSSVSAGATHVLAIREDGTLWAWGGNGHGQLGEGGTCPQSNVPLQLADRGPWALVTAGANHSLAIKKDGTLWSWGQNNYGQLGDGTTTDRSSPKLIWP